MQLSQEIIDDMKAGAEMCRGIMAKLASPMQSLPPLCLHVDERQVVIAFRRTQRHLESFRRELQRKVNQ